MEAEAVEVSRFRRKRTASTASSFRIPDLNLKEVCFIFVSVCAVHVSVCARRTSGALVCFKRECCLPLKQCDLKIFRSYPSQ